MTAVFVDSGGWIALLKRDDEDHLACAERYAMLSVARTHLLTSNYIVDEVATRLRYDAGLEAALAFRQIVECAVLERRLQLLWVDESIDSEAWRLLEHYTAPRLSLTDATSAVIARRRKVIQFFGLDHHFEALGFTVLPG